jgi:hypothetical protein
LIPENRSVRTLCLVLIATSFFVATSISETVVFFDNSFPAVENGVITRETLARALAPLNPRFVDLAALQTANSLKEGDLLILASGSAFPADAWDRIRHHVDHGNLLILGGRPCYIPVFREHEGWRVGGPQSTYSRALGITYSYLAPGASGSDVQWDEDAPFFRGLRIQANRVFVNSGYGGRYRGIGFLLYRSGNRSAAPVVADDFVWPGLLPHRRVYLSFDADSTFWNSHDGADLIRKSAVYASLGGVRLWLDLERLSLDPGEHITGAVDVVRTGQPCELAIELRSGSKVLASRRARCTSALHEEVGFSLPLSDPGLYDVRARLFFGDTLIEQYTTGVFVRDMKLLRSGEHLEAGRDYFRLGGNPYLMAGVNYFSTDAYTSGFFVGGSLGGNAWVWDRDFAEMTRQGITIVRTGIWLNRLSYLDKVSGAASERMLRGMESFLSVAARHHMQVIFTFFAFDPQTEMQRGPGQETDRLGPGSNPYLDPLAIGTEVAYIRSIVSRFREVPFLMYDLINEPSFSNPQRLWKGNSPNGDPAELAAWQQWLQKRYGTIENLATAWRTLPGDLGAFDRVSLPAYGDFEPARMGNPKNLRVVDYNLFAQNAFRQWVDTIILAIREAGSHQAITVGQDEGGVADRVLNHFWAESGVSFTVNHSWWRDDALLWSSVAAKTPGKPNIIGETGPQPVVSMEGVPRLDDIGGLPMLERKLALGFANANAGVLHWDWTRSDEFGLMRRDGSHKLWMSVLAGIAAFARDAQPYANESKLPEIALVMPQSLQLSCFGSSGVGVQQNAVRALYHYARGTAFAVGEYQLSEMPDPKLIIVPSPWILHQHAWDQLMARVQAGATLLVSGRIDADEHWISVPDRTLNWGIGYASAPLLTREGDVTWPEGTAHLTYAGDRTTYAERGVLKDGRTFVEIASGKGRILYFALPLEIGDQLSEIGRIYRYAMKRAGVNEVYETTCDDHGILISSTQLAEGTLYVITSESTKSDPVVFRDAASGKEIRIAIASGRAALILVGKDGRVRASYNVH